MPQLSISLAPSVAYQGQIAEPGAPSFNRTGRAEGASVVQGIPLKRGTVPGRQATPYAAADVVTPQNFAGFALLETSRPYSADAIEDDDSLALCRLGSVYLTLTNAAVAGHRVRMVMSTGALSSVAEDTAVLAGSCLLPGVRVAEDTSGAGLATCEVNLFGISGEASAAGPQRVGNIAIGAVALGSLGTSAVHVAGSIYASEIYVPEDMLVTSIAALNGATVGTDDLIFALADEDGLVLGTTALAGTLSAGANAFQTIALITPLQISRGRYFVLVQCDGTTATTRRIAASTYLNPSSVTAGVFGTLASITPPSTVTADTGPIAYLV